MSVKTNQVVGLLMMVQCLAGCASAPAMPPSQALPQAYEAGAPPTLGVGPSDLDAWWLAFNDPELTGLITSALEKSPTTDKARAVLDEARAVYKGSSNVWLPTGDPSIISSRTGTSLNSLGASTRTTSLTVAWETDLFGSQRTSIKVAQASYDQARFTYEATRAALAAEVATSAIRIKGLRQQLTDARETVRISEDLLRITRLKADRGLVGQVEISSFESDLATARAQVLLVTENLRSSQRSLLILLGRGREPTSSLPLPVTDFQVPQLPASLPSDLIKRRPDVRRDAAALAVATGNRKAARLGYFPTVVLEPIFTGTEIGGATTNVWTLEGILTQPLFSLPRIRTQVQVATARQKQALIGYQQSVDTAFGDAENAIGAYETDLKRLLEITRAQANAKAAFDAEKLRYNAGYSDQATLLQREQAWRQATTNYTTLRVSTLVDAVTAFKALGGGWTPPATDKN